MGLYRSSCHCGRVALEVEGKLDRVTLCNCSICEKKGYLHWIVPRSAIRSMAPEGSFSTYRFNTGVAEHHFCPVCGVAPFYIPRSDPDKIDVNARCLEGVDASALPVDYFDGHDWERARAGSDS